MKKHVIKKNVKYICTNLKFYFSLYLSTLGIIGAFIAVLSCIINTADILKEWHIAYKVLLVIGIYFVLGILILPLFFIKRRVVYYKNGEHEVSAEYGDISKISSKHGPQKIVVINVNTSFDMIIENPGSKALVAANSNHGRFISRVCKEKRINQKELNEEIQKMLSKQTTFKPVIVEREKGNINDYPIGTYVIYELGKISYLLFALSRFDENNNAYPGEESSEELPLDLLMKSINQSSQNLDVYIPLLGTGNSRYNLSNLESFNSIKHYLLSHKKRIESKYRILVFEGIKDEISIFKNS